MAEDKLIFQIGFDLEKGVKEAQKNADGYLRRIEDAIKKHPISVELQLEQKSGLSSTVKAETQRAAKELTGLKKEMAAINQEWNALSAKDRGGEVGARLMVQYRALKQEANGYISTVAAAVKEEDRLARQREKSANAAAKAAQKTREYNKELQEQDGYLSRLIKRIVVYAGYSYIHNFIVGIREVTAEFELQRVSLGAIIQDQQRANQLFSEIKSFALKSPIKILDLTKYVKQVAAYRIETDKLFDTTKRLADVSVGLGVDMGRLVLAYGQVKAASYLRAAEIRQFTEAGIPMLELLAEKFTEIQGKAVSTEQVMDLVSKRAVSFSMVEEIFKDMTDAGGMFYNMQEKQAQTLFGMWSKLGDAAAVMYEQIGNVGWVNEGMKAGIGLLEKMMRNWKTTARVLDTVAVATGVYVIGLKNATIASNALTLAEARRLTVEKEHLVVVPKFIAAIIGKGNALYFSIKLTNLHTAAMAREAAATNILTKGFWKLTAAMLANPFVLAAAAITAVGVALFHFIGNAETAAERAEKLNNSVAEFKNFENTVTPLIDTYNELINKTERTAAEEKKLSAVTHELAKRYPGAITAIGNFGNEIDLAADKLNDLYQAEKKARMDNTRHELEKTEQKIKETEKRIENLQAYLRKGTKTKIVGFGEGTQVITVQMSEEDKSKILQQIDELRFGKDGQSGLLGLQQSAEAAEAAMKGITVDQLRIEKFGGWKEELQGFSKVVDGLNMGKPIKLFDDTTINGFNSLYDALEEIAKQYKTNKALAEQYAKTLESKTISDETRAQTEELKAEAETMAELSYAALVRFNALKLLQESGGGGGSDPRLGVLQEMVSSLKNINKEYDDLAKKEGATKALADTQRVYADTFKNMQSLAKKYKFELPEFGVPTDAATLTKYLDAIREQMKKLPKSDKAVLSLQVDIDKIDIDAQQKKIEKQLKELADKISRTKTAKEFYDKVLGMTGDYELAAKVSMSIYGDTGYDLQKQLAEQVRQYFQNDKVNIEIPVDVITADNQINYKRLGEFAEQMKEKLGEEPYKAIKKIAEEGQKDLAKTYEGYLKDLEKAKTYADKRVELARTTAEKIRDIERNPQYTEEQKTKLKRGYQEREEREAAKLEYEAFKDTPLYVQMFEDLEHASTSTLESMKQKLLSMQSVWGSALDPAQLKEMQSRLNEIDNQLRERNPFKSLKEAYISYKDTVKDYSTSGAEANIATAQSNYEKAVKDTGADSKEAIAAKKTLDIEKQRLEIARQLTDENGKRLTGQKAIDMAAQIANEREAQARVDLAQAEASYQQAIKDSGSPESDAAKAAYDVVEQKKEALNLAQQTSEVVQQDAEASKTLKDSFVAAGNQIVQGLNMAGDLAAGIGKMTEVFGGSEEDVQYWNDVSDALGEISSGIGDVVQAAMSGNPMAVVSGVITAIPKMFSGFANLFAAGKIRKANKEIKKQQKILDQLEYSYGRLEKAAEKAFGGDYIKNFKDQQANLQAQIEATEKQLAAEQSKGKKADDDKIKEYKEQIRDLKDELADMQGALAEHFLGTDLTSAARDFAKAWLDAYKEFGKTADAMSEKFQEMIENMVVEGVLAAVMQKALEPIFKMIDEYNGEFNDEDFWREVVATAKKGAEDADAGASIVMKFLEQAGLSIRDLGGDLTGISRDIASASEESINGLAATMNTWSYYVSYVPQIAQNVAALRAILEGGVTPIQSGQGVTDLVTLQNQSLTHLQDISRHTAETVTECQRIAERCTAMAEDIHRVVVPKGTKGNYAVQTQVS